MVKVDVVEEPCGICGESPSFSFNGKILCEGCMEALEARLQVVEKLRLDREKELNFLAGGLVATWKSAMEKLANRVENSMGEDSEAAELLEEMKKAESQILGAANWARRQIESRKRYRSGAKWPFSK